VNAPTWTEADQAELDVLTWEFVDGAWNHRERCSVCSRGGPWCNGVRKAFELLLDWQRLRQLLTRAEALREHQDAKVAA
jgi:hypothetical protein